MSEVRIVHGLRRSMIHLGQRRVELTSGPFVVHFFRDLARRESAMAIVRGDLAGATPIPARVHSSCLTSECLMGRDCDCAEQLEGALAAMADAERGVLFYLLQEGRGAGLTAKARDRMIVQASENRVTTFEAYAEMGLPSDLRRYDAVAPMSRLLSIAAPVSLLTNNPEKAAAVTKALAEEGIEVCRTESIQGPTSVFNHDYLSAKLDSGHVLDRPDAMTGALPPGPVRIVAPTVLPGDPNRILTAAYCLPVANVLDVERSARDAIQWFRVAVVFDCTTARESIWMMRPSPQDPAAAVIAAGVPQVIEMTLLDRLPRVVADRRDRLRDALRTVSAGRVGAVRIDFDDRDRAER